MSSAVKFQPDNCPKIKIDIQIEIRQYIIWISLRLPMLRSSGSLSIKSSIVAIVKWDADVNQMSSNLLKS